MTMVLPVLVSVQLDRGSPIKVSRSRQGVRRRDWPSTNGNHILNMAVRLRDYY